MTTQNMIQYGVWSNCCNACKFCLREERIPYSKSQQLQMLDKIKKNLDYIDWENRFSHGISLLGGELYYITDREVQESFLELIDLIIEKVLRVSKNPACRYSTVTNGLYDPKFLYEVMDKITNAVGVKYLDINFSYDLKYRFANEEARKLVIKNINAFCDRYSYTVGVQMILTQHVINEWKAGRFSVNSFVENTFPKGQLCFLYPHPIKTEITLSDFNFKRPDFLEFIRYLKTENQNIYLSFLHSVKNSCSFKYTGLKDRLSNDYTEQPRLTDGKEIINPTCNHSMLYTCYSDSDRCMFCDLLAFDNEAYL